MKQAATIELFSYWDALRAGFDRAILDAAPEQVRALLASTFLVEVDDRRAYPLRVVGGTLTRITANARLGASFLECWEPGSRDLLESMLRTVHDERVPVVLGGRTRRGDGTQLAVESLLLPLATNRGGKPRILGGMAPAGVINRRDPPGALEVVSARAIRAPLPPSGFARSRPAPIVTVKQKGPPIRTPALHLHVIEGGRS